MADRDVWNLGGPLAAPAAADRVPMASGAGAGGYSLRGSFIWKDAAGVFRADGDVIVGGAAVTPLFGRTVQVGDGSINATMSLVGPAAAGYIATFGANVFLLARAGASLQLGANDATAVTISTAGNVSMSGNLALGIAAAAVRLHAKSTGEINRLESTTARGFGSCFSAFHDPTGQKAYFAYAGGDDTFYQMNRMNAGIIFGTNDINRWQIASNGHFYPQTDNVYSFGASGARPSVLWSATGTISTSDEREKKWRGALSEAELRAGRRILDELGFYQWKDALAAKGAEARFHFGARAQRVWAIMAEEGLVDPINKGRPGKVPYAFLCWDEWAARSAGPKPKKGQPDTRSPSVKAGNRYGLRVDQFTLFLVAVLDAERRAQDLRLAALEEAVAALQKG
mgnify:CR=1 FL=1